MLPSPGDTDVEQPPLLRDLIKGRRQREGHGAFLHTKQCDGVPLESLSGMQCGHGHTLCEDGTCCASARRSSSATMTARSTCSPTPFVMSSATLSNAASDSQRSRTAPAPVGGSGAQPSVASTALTCSA